jgi:hypothetical protein
MRTNLQIALKNPEHRYNALVQIDSLLGIIAAVIVGMWIEGAFPTYIPVIAVGIYLLLGSVTIKAWAKAMKYIIKKDS